MGRGSQWVFWPIWALSLVTFISISLPAVAVEGYRNELGHNRSNINYQEGTDIIMVSTAFEHYIRPVMISQVMPRREAAFLQQAGSVGITVGETDASGSTDASIKDEGAQITLAEKNKPWVLQWRYQKHKGTASEQTNTDIEAKFTDYKIGYYVRDGVMISLLYNHSDIKLSTYPGKTTGTRYEYALKWVAIRSGKKATNVEVLVGNAREKGAAGSHNSQVILISGDYYFSPDTSLGVLYSKKSHDDKMFEGARTDVRLSHFVTPRLFVGANVGRFQASHSSGEDDENQELFVGYRF